VLALLLARRGVAVTLLEAHFDFNREFRGDAIHPPTLDLMRQLSLLDSLLELPHVRVQTVTLRTRTRSIPYLDFRYLRSDYPYVLGMLQPLFLQFLTEQAARYSNFKLRMGARVEQLVTDAGRVAGVRYRCGNGMHELRANLVVGADGRFSRVRELARLPRTSSAQPIDLLWFRLPRLTSDPTDGGLFVRGGRFAYIRNRGDVWQVAYMLPKGDYQQLRAAGLEAMYKSMADLLPWLGDRIALIEDWRQTSVFSVEASRARQWYRPGLLLIGDAAHVMSPVGGVGINLAIQDAVAAANLVGPHLRDGAPAVGRLAAIQGRRELPTRLIQLFQDLLLQYILSCDGPAVGRLLPGRVAEQVPGLRAVRARLFAFGGFSPERLTG
jgi:2-polyprenyl-6-methoxyphenol hydroxylase-like FAD-dependent oxidoreductase